MKKLSAILLLMTVAALAFSEPFGLRMGMTLSEIAEVCGGKKPQHLQEDIYQIQPVQRDSFSTFVALVDEEFGLYYIRALTSEIQTAKFGTELKSAFESAKSELSKVYGTAVVVDKISSSSKLKKPSDWTNALGKGDRELYCTWTAEMDKELPYEVDMVTLTAKAEYSIKGYLFIEYQFSNYYDVKGDGFYY